MPGMLGGMVPRLGVSATGPRPLDEVWERFARPALWPEWAPQIRRVESSAPRLADGVTGRVHGPAGVRVDFRVEAWSDADHRWAWTVTVPGLPRPAVRMVHTVAAASDGRTSATVLVPAWLVAYLPVARLALHRLVH